MTNSCRLCGNNKPLQESHVIPKFVYKWLVKSSGGGFLRFGPSPNKRVQDGYKFYWLCSDCEGLFNTWETEFANKIFYPILNGDKVNVSYNIWLIKFCTSVSWRVLNLFREKGQLNHYPENLKNSADNAFHVWKEFLLDERPHPDKYQQHLLPMDIIENYTGNDMPPNINRYILRTVDVDAVHNKSSAFTYSKLERFVILGFIEEPKPRSWEGTKVNLKKGTVGPRSYSIPGPFGEYFMGKAKRMMQLQSTISDNQNKKIEETFKKNIHKIPDSETFRAMNQDVKLFGSDAFFLDNEE